MTSNIRKILPYQSSDEERIKLLIKEVARLEGVIREKEIAIREWSAMWKRAAIASGEYVECQS